MSNLVVHTREESKLLFIGGKVYKLFLTPLVTHGVIKDLLRLDKKINALPVFLGIDSVENTPLFEEVDVKVYKSDVLIMRKLSDGYFIIDILKNNNIKINIEKIVSKLYLFHKNSVQSKKAFSGDYLWSRFVSDYNLLSKCNSLDKYYINLLEVFKRTIDENSKIINSRFESNKIIEGHGDLDLSHIHFDSGRYAFIDFSHNMKYRFDDISRDIAGIYLDFVKLNHFDLAKLFLNIYKNNSGDKDLDTMVKLQIIKKTLLRYFIHSGGFSEKHLNDDLKDIELLNIRNLLRYYENT